VTGSGACLLGSTPPPVAPHLQLLRKGRGCSAITGITTGRVVDYGLKDSLNMGGSLAPAAFDTIRRHLLYFDRMPSAYDAIVTGDLGVVGQKILIQLLREKNMDIASRHQDCGLLICDAQTQDTHSGGSGCGCSAAVLCS